MKKCNENVYQKNSIPMIKDFLWNSLQTNVGKIKKQFINFIQYLFCQQYNCVCLSYYYFKKQMEVVLGDVNYPIAQTIIFFFLILSLIFNTFLFRRGQGNYSIKYQLMRTQLFFRQHMFFTHLIDIIYKFFFLLPFLLLITLTVLAALRDPKNISPILINGLIILLILYPTKTLHFYYKLFIIWLLVVGSQLSTLFIYQRFGQQSYLILSTIFYTGNILFFYLALVSIENVYWEVSQGFTQNQQALAQINPQWVSNYIQNKQSILKQNNDVSQSQKQKMGIDVSNVKNQLKNKTKQAVDVINNFVGDNGQISQKQYVENNNFPKIFNGGLYGYLTKNTKYRYLQYMFLYFISLIFLGIYAYLVHLMLDSMLGVVGLVSAVIYDIFIQIFNVLQNDGRSLKTVYVVLVVSRFFSFVFGIQNWILGYCVLYFGISIFIGWIIIQKRFPLRQKDKANKKKQKTRLNALKTPQFVMLVLTVQIIVMLLVQAYALTAQDPTLSYNNVTIPIWQWGVLAVIGAWVIIIYLLSIRVLSRHRYKIFQLTQYYFGITKITQYHIYVLTSYLLLIAIGLYALLYLYQKIVLICTIFLPLLYLCLLQIRIAWSKNQYKILADTQEYNIRVLKKMEEQSRKNQKLKNKNKKDQYLKNTRLMKTQTGMIQSYKNLMNRSLTQIKYMTNNTNNNNNNNNNNNKQNEIKQGQDSKIQINQNPTLNLYRISPQQMPSNNEIKEQNKNILINWRKQDIKCTQIWSCLTPYDKKIILTSILFVILAVGFCVLCMLWANNKFGISLMVCVISYLTLYVYVKYYKTKQQFKIYHIIISWLGFTLGIVYWSIFHNQLIGAIGYSLAYIILSIYVLIKCYQTNIVPILIICLIIQIIANMVFIQIIFAVHTTVVYATIFGVLFAIVVILQVPLYFKLTQDHIPKLVLILTSIPIGIIVITISIIGYINHILSSFAIFSIIMFIIFISLFITATILYLYKKKHNQENPNIYSAYGQPYYRFQSGSQVMKYNIDHIIVFSFSMITLVVYSVIVSVFFIQKQWAVFCLSIFWLIDSFVNLQAAMSSYLFIGQYKNKGLLTKQILIQSFKKLNNQYMAEQVQGEPSSYFKYKLQQAKLKAQADSTAQNWEQVVKFHDLYSKNLKQQEKFLFFWTGLIMFNLMSKQRQNICQTLTQLKQIEDELGQFGIVLQSLNLALPPKEKYDKVMKQIQNLQPVQYILYEETLKQHRIDMARKKKQSQQMHKKQKQQNQKRQQQLFDEMKRQEQNERKRKHQDPIKKFNQIVQSIRKNRFYQDKQFPADKTVLGDALSQLVPSWRRPSINQIFSKQGINAADIKQGKLGDCYLLSSFAVLGQQRINQAIGYDPQQKKWRWVNQKEKGVYMVRFYKFSKQKYVIIDDMLPSNQSQEWVFAKSQDPSQYWPCILQKAYAKLYGGYHKIIEGKCSQVLAQFTNGFPSQILLENYKSNPYGLWSRIMSSKKNRYLMAAGSPPNAKGDTAFSKRGIVQGHAYSILDAQQQDQYKLIKLKNPHGSEGRQWTGDFSDKSDFLTKVMMQKLGHTRAKDGIFWMPLEDFILQFKSLYICAIFDKQWKQLGPLAGQWTDDNSYGLPNQDGAQNNPHYGIKVTKKCTLFLSLTQQNETALQGKNYIFIKVVRNNGKRITPASISSQNSIGRSKVVTNAVTISDEIELQANEYPYTFSIMLCCSKRGNTGKYTLLAYCDDKQSQIIKDQDFDRKK